MSDTPDSPPIDFFVGSVLESQRQYAGTTAAVDEVTALFEEYRVRVIRYLLSIGLPIHDGEEIAQEVFLLLFQHLRQEKSRENLRGWIFQVAHNLGLKRRTRTQTREAVQELAESLPTEMEDPGPDPEEQAAMRQRQRRLLAVLEALPSQDRSCLFLRSEGLRYREIAEVLNISLGSVSESLARAIRRLNHVYHR